MRHLSWILLLFGCAGPVGPTQPIRTYVETIRGTDVEFEMVWIASHGFWIGRTEVTWDEYLAYCDFGERESIPPGVDAVSRPSKPLETFPYDREWGTGRRPAVGISWNAAKQYCRWLSSHTGRTYRLPTEAEWRAACGRAPSDIDAFAWHAGNSGGMTREVATKRPNEFGLFDMLGNVQEYTADAFDPAEPEWPALRGGSWEQSAGECAPSARVGFDEFWVLDDPNVPPGVWWVPEGQSIGFRVLSELVSFGGNAQNQAANRVPRRSNG